MAVVGCGQWTEVTVARRSRSATVALVTAAAAVLTACGGSSGSDSSTRTPASSTAAASSSARTTASSTKVTGASSGSVSPPADGPAGGPVPAGFVPVSTTWISASTGWALGTAPCPHPVCTSLARTSDGGRTWVGVPAPTAPTPQPNHAATGGTVDEVRFADARNGWAAGDALLATHDGGATWTPITTFGQNLLAGSVQTSGGYAYVIAAACDPAKDCDAPASVWAAPAGSDQWRSIAGSIPHEAGPIPALTVTGGRWFVLGRDGIHIGDPNGQTGILPDPCGDTLRQYLTAADPQHLDLACGDVPASGSQRIQLYGSTDGGHTWAKAGAQHTTGDLVAIADNTRGVLELATAQASNDLLRTTDDGATVQPAEVNTPAGGYRWADLGFTTPTRAVVVLVGKALYVSDDAGATWTATRFGR